MIVLVLFIWGKVIWDIVDADSGHDEFVSEINVVHAIDETEMKVMDTYQLLDRYRDPFLDKEHVPDRIKPTKTVDRPIKQKAEAPVVTVNWPEVKYLGRMQNNQTGKQSAILVNQSKEMVVFEGDSIADAFQIYVIQRDSLVLACNGHFKTYYK
ncbi:MAG: hypothetical protein KDC12_09550 [Flavobacteriales bacterium]|nr:hypothetical protein [Flavobacteriales bacterium]